MTLKEMQVSYAMFELVYYVNAHTISVNSK